MTCDDSEVSGESVLIEYRLIYVGKGLELAVVLRISEVVSCC